MSENIQYKDNVLTSVNAITAITILASCTAIRGEKGDYAFLLAKDTLESCFFEQNSQLQTIQDYSFYECSKLASIDLSVCNELTYIGNYAFASCTSLATVKLPESLTSIQSYAFHTTNFASIIIPANVEYIGSWAFAIIKTLTSFTFGENSKITNINDHILCQSQITTFHIPRYLKSLNGNTFDSCYSLTTITYDNLNDYLVVINNLVYDKDKTTLFCCPPGIKGTVKIIDSVTTIASCAFVTSRISIVEFPNNLKTIASWCFASSTISQLNLPPNCTVISNDAFRDCKQLTSIVFEEGLETIGNSAFAQCINLKQVQFPSTLKNLGGGAFVGIDDINITFSPESDLEYESERLWIVNKDKTSLKQSLGDNSSYLIDDSFKIIGYGAFYQKTTLQEIHFSEDSNLEIIEDKAFCECTSLFHINFPQSLISIGYSSFAYCQNLTILDFTQNTNLILIDSEAFLSCNKIITLNFPQKPDDTRSSSFLELKECAFQNCLSIINFNLGNSVSQIGESCFENCYNIQSINIPDSLTILNSSAFRNCSKIETITFGETNSITDIPSYLCYNCRKLNKFVFPPLITVINSFAFVNTALVSIELPKEVKLIRRSSFQGCQSLINFSIPNDSKLSEFESNVFSDCISFKEIKNECDNFQLWNKALFDENMTELIILPPACGVRYFGFPETIKTIRTSALENVFSLEVVFISTSVKQIHSYAFRHCTNLRYINIPQNVIDIGKNAFEGCKNLQCGISIENQTPEYITNLLQVSQLPERCLQNCIKVCTNSNNQIFSLKFTGILLFVFDSSNL